MTLYEVRLDGLLDSQPMKTVLHYDIVGSTDFQAFIDAIRLEMLNGLTDAIVPSASWQGATIRELSVGSVGVPYTFTNGSLAGTNSTTGYNARTAANVQKLTGSTIKPTQGRVFQSGVPSDVWTSDGFLEPGYGSNLRDAWDNLRIIEFDGTAEGAMHVVATNPSAPNTQVSTPVISFNTRGKSSIQSRRNFNT